MRELEGCSLQVLHRESSPSEKCGDKSQLTWKERTGLTGESRFCKGGNRKRSLMKYRRICGMSHWVSTSTA